jgi:beta-phosphoglucomutase-like phosphatase (HAD superfamily)
VVGRAGLTSLFELIYDGNDLARDGLLGKPRPDVFLRAAARLGVRPAAAAVVEDAVAGIAAARAGGFALVIGIDRGAGRAELAAAGADLVVHDLAELMPSASRTTEPLP